MKAIIPAAGLGTRFLPIAKAVPKEMLPLGDKPVIHYVVAEAAAAGFDEILIVISQGKECIQHYFAPNPDLERHLEKIGKLQALEDVRAVSRLARISYTYQKEMRGLGDAVLLGREFVGNDSLFAVLLGDTVMHQSSPLPAMRAAWEKWRQPSVCLERCPAERVSKYGVAGGTLREDGVFTLDRLVEKPAPDAAPRLRSADGVPLPFHAFAARYLFTPQIFDHLENTHAGFGGEIQLTDAMEQLRLRDGMLGVTWPGKRLDIGNPAGLIDAARLY
ncbi:UTP--glucose-1-phosphate uridylyltransferase [Geminisphaera colitermitum]|uniref:UTP--glucose-1-phosphate uridylyltransferase n=1 Tax=Geminisphaera colitermitum TaxID=1148786 RepID=UPI000158CBD7|nr:sugar phosphate nucleotidyltransferase [Geminisphaera colitermitum]